MSDSDEDGSVPPDAQGEAVGADDLPQAAGSNAPAPQHPVWAAAAGAGRGAGAANKNRSDKVFGPISMAELEIRGRDDLDGGSSTASVRGEDRPKARGHGGRREKQGKRSQKRPREYDDDDDDDDDDDGWGSSASLDMAGAAFGGATAKGRAACASEASDDGVSVSSSVVRRRHERAFPVTGVTCVGCALPAKITPVTDFISKSMSTMSELALYKMAALVYKTKVAEPAEEEGVDVPPWGAPVCTTPPRAPRSPTPRRAAHAQTGRRSARTSSCTRSTRACSATRTSARSRPCARRSRCSCCAATPRRASSRSTRTTPRPS